ncbi:unnamed protein product [Cyclocybe aegerita]|uniref:FAD/NAD(P)-binding domain-containing protein n=1 Tax=Cyclocybe aegerita TaxID=1973307 RepID=A0A8S0WL27_CYCAE|nr:unnamed protein product [Cyclocybe aegerita]
MPRTVKVAVVGSGLAGLTAAYLLKKPLQEADVDFEVHVFEKASSIGMDSASISVPMSGDQEWRVDVPMRSFQGGYYTQLIALYRSLGVDFRQKNFSYSFSDLSPERKVHQRSITTSFIYNGASGRAGISKPSSLSPSPLQKDPSTLLRHAWDIWTWLLYLGTALQVVFCYLITLYHALPFWRPRNIPDLTFRDWTSRAAPTSFIAKSVGMDTAWQDYIEMILIPLVSAVCTSPEDVVMDHPVEEILDYVWLTLGTNHYVVVDGVCDVVARLTADLHHIHLASPILSIKPDPRDPGCATISCSTDGELKEYGGFRHIVFATQASGAVPILSSYSQSLDSDRESRKQMIAKQIECLKSFPYRKSIVINHFDDTLLPDNAQDVRDLNLLNLLKGAALSSPSDLQPSLPKFPNLCVSPTHTMATHVLPRPKGFDGKKPRLFQTTNPIIPPKMDTILSVATLERAVVNTESKKALRLLCVAQRPKWYQCSYQAKTQLGELQGGKTDSDGSEAPGIWFCGSYAHLGIPLLEGCVISARTVVEEGILRGECVRWKEEPWTT